MKETTITVRISKELRDRFKKYLEARGISISDFIISKIISFVEEAEKESVKMYRLSSSQTDRINFDEAVKNFTYETFNGLDNYARLDTYKNLDEYAEKYCESFVDEDTADDIEEAKVRFIDAFKKTFKSEFEEFINDNFRIVKNEESATAYLLAYNDAPFILEYLDPQDGWTAFWGLDENMTLLDAINDVDSNVLESLRTIR